MKNLNEYINESLLDDFDELDKDFHHNLIMKFLIDIYLLNGKPINPDTEKIKISNKPNKDNKYVVDVDGNLIIKNHDIYTLTSDLFIFGKVTGSFDCEGCKKLISLKGAPIKVGWSFDCEGCDNLTSLEGAPKEVRGYFNCSRCKKLTSLEGAPKIVQGHFYCNDCSNLKSLEGAPEKVGTNFYCFNCNNLASLKGGPKEVGRHFDCSRCNKLTSLEGAPKKVGTYFFRGSFEGC